MVGVPFAADAVVFDLDGVLVDSETLWATAEERVVVELGLPWDPRLHVELLGKGPLDAAAGLARYLRSRGHRSDESDAAGIAGRMLAHAEALFAAGVPLTDGVVDLLGALHGRVPLAVATNSRRVLAEHALDGNGLAPMFDTVVTADDVDRHKPAPDPYLLACRRLGARPQRSIGIDDSPPGIASAKAAGLWVIGYLPAGGVSDRADATVGSLRDIDLGPLAGAA